MATIGFDLEFFVSDEERIIPVCGKIGGDKSEHVRLSAQKGRRKLEYELHEDNVTLEVNSPVFDNEEAASEWLQELLPNLDYVLYRNKTGLSVPVPEYHTSMRFPVEELSKIGPQAIDIGCDPDFNAHSDDPHAPRQVRLYAFTRGIRFAGGHIHLGYENHKEIPPHYIAQIMDTFRASNKIPPRANGRHSTYGVGLFRPKPYGLEYRSPSTLETLTTSLPRQAFQLAQKLETSPQEVADWFFTVPVKDIVARRAKAKLPSFVRPIVPDEFSHLEGKLIRCPHPLDPFGNRPAFLDAQNKRKNRSYKYIG